MKSLNLNMHVEDGDGDGDGDGDEHAGGGKGGGEEKREEDDLSHLNLDIEIDSENIMDWGVGIGGGVGDGDHVDVIAELDEGMWFPRDQDEDLLDVHNAFINYDDFPPLPDFPCISSSSSSSCSSAPALTTNNNNNDVLRKPSDSTGTTTSSSASSSSVTSWVHQNKMDSSDEHQQQQQHRQHVLLSAGSGTLDNNNGQEGVVRFCSDDYMDVMEELGGMDLLDNEEIWDPSSLFPCEGLDDLFEKEEEKEGGGEGGGEGDGGKGVEGEGKDGEATAAADGKVKKENQQEATSTSTSTSDELAMVFFEWLKTNKESISAEDLRSVRLKRSTIECAAKRLGEGKEGMKQLLKLILEWIQNHQLQRKHTKEGEIANTPTTPSIANTTPFSPLPPPPPPPPPLPLPPQQPQVSQIPNPNPNPDLNSNPYLVPSMPQWVPHQSYIPESTTIYPPMMYGYEPVYNNGGLSVSPTFNNQGLIPQTWPPPPPPHHYPQSTAGHYPVYPDQTPSTSHPPPAPVHHTAPPPLQPRPFGPFVNPYPSQLYPAQSSERLVRLGSSATKEARKKRMARQKRFFSHSRTHNHHHQQTNETRLGNDTNCATTSRHPNWLYWPPSSGNASPPSMLMSDPQPSPPPAPPPVQGDGQTMQPQSYSRQASSDKRQGGKTGVEKNLKFLLQKVLKQSDVGNLGRIVLPKKEAETYLPGLDARDGISIAMEDIGTSRVWNMRYRFWPNNKSRMYLLENTGEFVRSNGLQEGDFIVIYSDVKCGKFLIRGVKVRQPGPKPEPKKQGKMQRNHLGSGNTVLGPATWNMKETRR